MSFSTVLFREGKLSYRIFSTARKMSAEPHMEGKLSHNILQPARKMSTKMFGENKLPYCVPVPARKMSTDPMELFTADKLSYRILTPEHRDAALIVLARAFCTEPATSALGEIRPEMRTELHDWVEFVDYWMDHCSSNGLSVMAMDVERGSIAGVAIVRDLMMVPPGFYEKYTSGNKTLSPWMNFLWHMDAEATKKMPELGEPGKAVDFWMGAVHPNYRGSKIMSRLFPATFPLAQQAGFKYGTAETTNAVTSQLCFANEFTAVHEEEAAEWLWRGEPLYTNQKKPHGKWTFWVKDLQTGGHERALPLQV
eukprot:GFUD01005975.1.p1 GENE.GFUD01005975.1~~GFUD01005975.1.p1  ORF type:complete len:310 (+),score=55.30 GFUD01005975.1:117-1046(+)